MSIYNLNLTAINSEFDNKNHNQNFYLGQWCFAEKEKDDFNDLNIHEYHWNNRTKFQEDYKGLNNFISYNFNTISNYMGEINQTTKDQRYWRINLGIWIGCLIQILFDRWENIRTLPKVEYNLNYLNIDISTLRTNTVKDFFEETSTDQYNEILYRLILEAQNIKINYKNSESFKSNFFNYNTIDQSKIKTKNSLKIKVIKFLISIVHRLQKPKYFIIASYMNIFE